MGGGDLESSAHNLATPNRKFSIIERNRHMKVATVGIILIILGIAGFAVGGISFTHEKKDVDLGPVQVAHEQKKTLPISPS